MKKVLQGCCSMRTVNVRWGLVGLVVWKDLQNCSFVCGDADF